MTRFPDNKAFAFTIFDDTDLSTVENVIPIYRLLTELGMRTTKSVWPLASVPGARFDGATLQERSYLHFIEGLQDSGFEIALHNVRNGDSTRDQVHRGIEEFRRLLGRYPRAHANHSSNRENIYWGAARFNTLAPLYRAADRLRESSFPVFEGHLQNSPFFWGDLCRDHIDYVRNFTFAEINLDRVNPSLPYNDPRRPFVKAWFSSSDGSDAQSFCDLLSEAKQDRLEAEGGVAIVYTHFACGFVRNGTTHPRVEMLLRRLARKNGWFVPVSTLLDYLRARRGLAISNAELAAMECRWLRDRFTFECAKGLRRLHLRPNPELSNASA
jgi:hypothetical protein